MSIPVSKPFLEKAEINLAVKSLKQGFLGMGKYVALFEKNLSNYLKLKNRYLGLVSTGTDAIHMGLIIAGVKKNDEVIIPSINFVADAQAVLAIGAKPVLCDVTNDTLCINPYEINKLITKKTKAIIIMDYSCHLCDYNKINKIAKSHNLRIIHDAAHSFGSSLLGKKIGTFSDICIFSFDPVKTITSIEKETANL